MTSHKADDKATAVDIPEYLIDSKKNVTYRRLRFFGKVTIAFLHLCLNDFIICLQI